MEITSFPSLFILIRDGTEDEELDLVEIGDPEGFIETVLRIKKICSSIKADSIQKVKELMHREFGLPNMLAQLPWECELLPRIRKQGRPKKKTFLMRTTIVNLLVKESLIGETDNGDGAKGR